MSARIASAVLAAMSCMPAAVAQRSDRNPYESPVAASEAGTPSSPIDALVFARLEQLDIPRSPRCSDAVFVRRVYLDVIGTLPTAREVRQFLRSDDPRKRSELIEALLERDEFADYLAMKWSDVLRVKSEFPINLWPNAAQAYHRWIHDCVAQNRGYDDFARELLTSSGSNFRVPAVNFYRAVQGQDPETLARAVALTFMGCRSENWSDQQRAGFAAFFAQVGFKSTKEWKEEIVFFDRGRPSLPAVFPDGTPADIDADIDPRSVFADWLIRADNPWFARAIANRIWSWLLGRGIAEPADDLRLDNLPCQPELLDWLSAELVRADFDLRQLIRLILESETYQLSSIPRGDPERTAAHFACYPLRRLEAEVLIDAINQITGGSETYTSAIPEPFTFIPTDHRTITLPDASITSPFLELFGRPPRDTGQEHERDNRTTAAQRLHLLNSSHIQDKLRPRRGKKSPLQFQGKGKNKGPQVVDHLYLTILSRFPTGAERRAIQRYIDQQPEQQPAARLDIVWALINTAEFLYRH